MHVPPGPTDVIWVLGRAVGVEQKGRDGVGHCDSVPSCACSHPIRDAWGPICARWPQGSRVSSRPPDALQGFAAGALVVSAPQTEVAWPQATTPGLPPSRCEPKVLQGFLTSSLGDSCRTARSFSEVRVALLQAGAGAGPGTPGPTRRSLHWPAVGPLARPTRRLRPWPRNYRQSKQKQAQHQPLQTPRLFPLASPSAARLPCRGLWVPRHSCPVLPVYVQPGLPVLLRLHLDGDISAAEERGGALVTSRSALSSPLLTAPPTCGTRNDTLSCPREGRAHRGADRGRTPAARDIGPQGRGGVQVAGRPISVGRSPLDFLHGPNVVTGVLKVGLEKNKTRQKKRRWRCGHSQRTRM